MPTPEGWTHTPEQRERFLAAIQLRSERTRARTSKRCPQCDETKGPDDFGRRGGDKAHLWKSWCLACEAGDTNARWRALTRSQQQEWNRLAALKRSYGLSGADYDRMVADQNGRCAICDREPKDRRLAVDHNHQTGAVRGLLCHPCNGAIGMFREDPDIMLSAMAYLEKYTPDAPQPPA